MLGTLEERDWTLLLRRIRDGECTPFLGAGTCYGVLPLGSDIAEKWAKEYHYPFKDSCKDLTEVAQFLAVEFDPVFPKGEIAKWFSSIKPPDFKKPDEPHAVLAKLPLPVYVTTNYDNFMVQALRSRNKNPVREFCRWNKYIESLENWPYLFDRNQDVEASFNPSAANPLVFHLHGIIEEKKSLVITNDDYLDFLVNIARNQKLIPPRIHEAFGGTSLLFVGYGLRDWDFRVLFRSIVSYLEKSTQMAHVSVQLLPGKDRVSEIQKAEDYLNRYFKNLRISVYWGECCQFLAELKQRWEEFNHGN